MSEIPNNEVRSDETTLQEQLEEYCQAILEQIERLLQLEESNIKDNKVQSLMIDLQSLLKDHPSITPQYQAELEKLREKVEEYELKVLIRKVIKIQQEIKQGEQNQAGKYVQAILALREKLSQVRPTLKKEYQAQIDALLGTAVKSAGVGMQKNLANANHTGSDQTSYI